MQNTNKNKSDHWVKEKHILLINTTMKHTIDWNDFIRMQYSGVKHYTELGPVWHRDK